VSNSQAGLERVIGCGGSHNVGVHSQEKVEPAVVVESNTIATDRPKGGPSRLLSLTSVNVQSPSFLRIALAGSDMVGDEQVEYAVGR